MSQARPETKASQRVTPAPWHRRHCSRVIMAGVLTWAARRVADHR